MVKKIKMDKSKHILITQGLVDARVCSEGTYDEALEFIRAYYPAGTQNNWGKNAEGSFAPIACAENAEGRPKRMHYMFIC